MIKYSREVGDFRKNTGKSVYKSSCFHYNYRENTLGIGAISLFRESLRGVFGETTAKTLYSSQHSGYVGNLLLFVGRYLLYFPGGRRQRHDRFESGASGIRIDVCHRRHDWHRLCHPVQSGKSGRQGGGPALFLQRLLVCPAGQPGVSFVWCALPGSGTDPSGSGPGDSGCGRALPADGAAFCTFLYAELYLYSLRPQR